MELSQETNFVIFQMLEEEKTITRHIEGQRPSNALNTQSYGLTAYVFEQS
jgi:hypothetical protein